MIEIQDVSKRYGRRVALSNVSLAIQPGEVTLLLGANGAGKSTLLRAILGIDSFDGRIRVVGLDPLKEGSAVRALVGYMPQSGGLHEDLTVAETMGFYASIRRAPRGRGEVLLNEAGLVEYSTAKIGDLSGGLRQRLGFVLALLTDPHILVLDEPSASLDAASRQWLASRLRAAADEGRVVLVSTHAGQELLAVGDRRIVLEDGRVVSSEGGASSRTIEAPAVGVVRGGSVAPLVRKELKDAIGNRWLIGYSSILGLLGVAAAATGLAGTSGLELQAFGRTTATLMNLCLLLSPLIAVLMGAAAIAGERERGTLEHLLAQPLSRTQLLAGKHAALVIALTAATVVGFLPAGALIASRTGGLAVHYAIFPAIAALVAAAMAAVGILISVLSRTGVQAQGAAVFTWFAFVLLYDLLLIGSLSAVDMPVQMLGAALAANPVDAARVLGVLALEPDLYLLGPAGAYLTTTLSRTGTAALLCGALVAWAAAPLLAALFRFRLPRARETQPGATAGLVPKRLRHGAGRRASAGSTSTGEVTLS